MKPENELMPSKPLRVPDPILAELWQVKRDITQEAGYDIGTLAQMAHEAAENARRQWRESESLSKKTAGAIP